VPLGPFTAKNFCTSISPWVVSMDALTPFQCAPSAGAFMRYYVMRFLVLGHLVFILILLVYYHSMKCYVTRFLDLYHLVRSYLSCHLTLYHLVSSSRIATCPILAYVTLSCFVFPCLVLYYPIVLKPTAVLMHHSTPHHTIPQHVTLYHINE
jgi:hypothetical protein